MNKLWGGRFEQGMDQKVMTFNASIDIDQALFEQDIEGSIAHVKMLKKQAIIPNHDADLIIKGLLEIKSSHNLQPLKFSKAYEDIHLNIEMLLYEKIGDVAGKMHTGRSRNDQVATDMHLFTKKQVTSLIEAIQAFQSTLVQFAKDNIDVIIPGYTHLQRAQPILFSHHLLTYFWMLQRDRDRLNDSLKRINISPLGSGALAGTTYPTDQRYTQQLLNFDDVYPNSIDAVSDRDYILETMHDINLIMMHLSRFAEELILWCSHEFNFVTLSDAYSTGSSIMPQKKNPDMAELIRGKSGTVSGHYIGLLMTLKGLPLAYNKDLQEDKQHFFESLKTCIDSVDIFNGMIETMTLNKSVIASALHHDFSNATELADYLVTLNIPFRKAHEITGQLVKQCIDQGIYLVDVPLSTYQTIHLSIDETVYEYLNPVNAVNRRQNENGTSTQSVLLQIRKAEALL